VLDRLDLDRRCVGRYFSHWNLKIDHATSRRSRGRPSTRIEATIRVLLDERITWIVLREMNDSSVSSTCILDGPVAISAEKAQVPGQSSSPAFFENTFYRELIDRARVTSFEGKNALCTSRD